MHEVWHDDVIRRVIFRLPVRNDSHARLTRSKLLTKRSIFGVGAAPVGIMKADVKKKWPKNNTGKSIFKTTPINSYSKYHNSLYLESLLFRNLRVRCLM